MKIIKKYYDEDIWEDSTIEDCIKFSPYDKESIIDILSNGDIVRSSCAEWKVKSENERRRPNTLTFLSIVKTDNNYSVYFNRQLTCYVYRINSHSRVKLVSKLLENPKLELVNSPRLFENGIRLDYYNKEID